MVLGSKFEAQAVNRNVDETFAATMREHPALGSVNDEPEPAVARGPIGQVYFLIGGHEGDEFERHDGVAPAGRHGTENFCAGPAPRLSLESRSDARVDELGAVWRASGGRRDALDEIGGRVA